MYCRINPPTAMPWFGIDIGGTLTKLVYFEPLDETLQTSHQNGDAHFVNNTKDTKKEGDSGKKTKRMRVISEDDYGDESPGAVLRRIHKYLVGRVAYGKSGVRDEHLEMLVMSFGGRQGLFHFIRFPTADMKAFLSLVRQKNLRSLATGIYATGGGAYKFESEFKKVVN